MSHNVLVFTDVLPDELLEHYKNKISRHYDLACAAGMDPFSFEESRTLDITNDKVVKVICQYLSDRTGYDLQLEQAELQVWPVGSHSELHIHDSFSRACTDYNSLLYLNEEFNGGEFFTEHGFQFKPKTNALTFFNGRNVYHGVKTVSGKHRYTMIFWWKNTKLGAT